MPLPAPPVLLLTDLRFAFAGEPPLFDGMSLALPAGLHWLQGDAGSGKTTLLRVLASELPGTARAALAGVPTATDSAAWRSAVCHLDARGEALDDLTPAALRERLRLRHPALDAEVGVVVRAAFHQHEALGLAARRSYSARPSSGGSAGRRCRAPPAPARRTGRCARRRRSAA
jgi:ABC-type transport system involved in cytochrome bd biosynthesis fused ATPase/permease subunit